MPFNIGWDRDVNTVEDAEGGYLLASIAGRVPSNSQKEHEL
jgi:hypothetical protein